MSTDRAGPAPNRRIARARTRPPPVPRDRRGPRASAARPPAGAAPPPPGPASPLAASSPPHRTDRLLDAALAIVAAHDLDALLAETARQAAEVVGAQHATVGLTADRDRSGAASATHLSAAVAGLGPDWFRTAHASLAAEVCRTNRPIRAGAAVAETAPADAAGDGRGDRTPQELALGFLGVPLVGHEGRNLGLIQLSNRLEGAFDVEDEELLVSLAQFAALAIEQLRLGADLAYQSRLTRTVAENATSGLVLLDPTGEVTYLNSAAREILGYELEELAGRPLHAIVHHTSRDGTPLPMADCRIWQAVAGAERPQSPFEDAFIRRDGSFYPVRLSAAPILREGHLTGVVLEVQDMSAEHAIQSRLRDLALSASDRAAKLRGLIESIGDAVIVCESDGRISLVNPAAVVLFGRRLEHVRELADRLRTEGGRPIATDRPLVGSFLMAGRARETWIEARSFLVPSGPGSVRYEGPPGRPGDHGWICVLRDVTRERQAKLLRETFIGMLSHELRTPITTVYGGAKVLARRTDDLAEDVRAIVSDIESESERLYRLVEDLVVLTKSESASLEANREPILLQRLIPHVVANEARRWPTVTFRVDETSGVPAVLAEPTYLEQIVRNLLANAAKYGGAMGPVEVTVTSEGERAVVRVLDEGPGFPAEDADRLFDIYYRSPAIAQRTAGAGIGLFVSKALVESMDGEIWARRRPTGGAEFGFALPVIGDTWQDDD